MDFDERLSVLQAAEGDPALLALSMVDLVHSELPMEEREAIRCALLAAAVPHWFDPPFLAALLAVNEPEAEWLHGQLCALTSVEPFSARGQRAVNVHESARLVLREHLRLSDPERWRTLAQRARAHLAASTSVHNRIEALHHLFAIDQEAAAAECVTLDRALLHNPEWKKSLAISLSEVATFSWLRGSALVEALLIPLQVRSNRGEASKLQMEAGRLLKLAEKASHLPGIARAECLLGDVILAKGNLDSALAHFQNSLTTLEHLAQVNPSNPGWKHDLSVAYSRLGLALVLKGESQSAYASYHKSLAIILQLVQNDFSNSLWQWELAQAYSYIGGLLLSKGVINDANDAFQNSLKIHQNLVKDDSLNADFQLALAEAYFNLGQASTKDRRTDDAQSFTQEALAIVERLAQEDPSNSSIQLELSGIYLGLGDILQKQNKRDAAYESFQKSCTILKYLAENDPGNVFISGLLEKANNGAVKTRRLLQKDKKRAKGFLPRDKKRGSGNR